MASDNETVEEIANKVRAGDYGCSKCGDSCDCPNTDKIISNIIARILAAHKREVDTLNFKLMTAKSEQKTAANVIIEQTNKVEKLERAVAELRECLKEAFAEKCSGARHCDGCWGHPSCKFER